MNPPGDLDSPFKVIWVNQWELHKKAACCGDYSSKWGMKQEDDDEIFHGDDEFSLTRTSVVSMRTRPDTTCYAGDFLSGLSVAKTSNKAVALQEKRSVVVADS